MVASLDASRYTERGRKRVTDSLIETWHQRLNIFGISEPIITAASDDTFNITVPLSADRSLVGRIIQESGEITLHLFKEGADVQALRRRIDNVVRERAIVDTESFGEFEKTGLSGLLASITVDEEISDIAVRENNVDAVKSILADSTVQANIRAFNLANPPAGEFAWASESVERAGRVYYPLYFINHDFDLNAQPLESVIVSDATVTAERGAYAVRLFLADEGRESLANLSSANAGNRLAIKMNGQVYVTLNIQGKIPDGRIEIPGGATLEEARALAVILDSELPRVDVVLGKQSTGNSFNLYGSNIVGSVVRSTFVSLSLIAAMFLIRYRATGALFVGGILYLLIMTGAVLRLWNIAGLVPYFTLAGMAGFMCALLLFTVVHLWIFEYLRTESNIESKVRQAVTVTLDKVKPVVVWVHVMLFLISLSLVVFGTNGAINFGLLLFSGTAGSLLTVFFWTNMLLSSLVAEWQIKKLSL